MIPICRPSNEQILHSVIGRSYLIPWMQALKLGLQLKIITRWVNPTGMKHTAHRSIAPKTHRHVYHRNHTYFSNIHVCACVRESHHTMNSRIIFPITTYIGIYITVQLGFTDSCWKNGYRTENNTVCIYLKWFQDNYHICYLVHQTIL